MFLSSLMLTRVSVLISTIIINVIHITSFIFLAMDLTPAYNKLSGLGIVSTGFIIGILSYILKRRKRKKEQTI